MFKPFVRILVKTIELVGCISCVVCKNLTDQKSRRISLRNQKYSREWSLLDNVTWSGEGNDFANVSYGGFTLITFLLLIYRCINAKSKPVLIEKIFIAVGVILFFATGGLVYASLEQIPVELQDNAIILGTLSFIVAFVFLVDLTDPISRFTSGHTQTEETPVEPSETQERKELNIFSMHTDAPPSISSDISVLPPENYYIPEDQVDVIRTRTFPTPQQPVFAKVLMPEKKRPLKKATTLLKGVESTHILCGSQSNDNSTGTQLKRFAKRPWSNSENVTETPVKTGFVAQAARMWDRRVQRGETKLSTIV